MQDLRSHGGSVAFFIGKIGNMRNTVFWIVLCSLCPAGSWAAEDIVLADFEGKDWGDWKVEGDAFGLGPASGSIGRQKKVSGYRGHGLVNSYHEGDKATGTLTSPELKIERKFINLLVGGGRKPGDLAVELLIDERPVRTATGADSEQLRWQSWDVAELIGKTARIRIVDKATGGWGHILVDQIVASDESCIVPESQLRREIVLQQRYLNLPVKNGAARRRMEISIDGKPIRIFDIELADGQPDWWAPADLGQYRGKTALVRVDSLERGSQGLAQIEQGEQIKDAEHLYNEPLRPQFHFSQKRGWNNDPNGMVYYDGQWHLFYQHNPYGIGWGNMHWGHAVTKDLVHWEELLIALYPWTMAKDHCFSGSAAVDWNNTSGFQTDKEKVLVAAFTDTGCGEAIAYSNDRGLTWTYWQGNPAIKHGGRDPKIIWYAPGKHWVLACYDTRPPQGRNIAFYTSPNLKDWTFQSLIAGYHECPEIFELPVDGDKAKTRWVVYAADAKYVIGRFDGRTFTPEHEGKHQVHWGAYYASQTFSDAPDGRRVQIGWGRIGMPGMPFSQMMTFPCELTLHKTEDGIRMFAHPVKEIELLHDKAYVQSDVVLKADQPLEVPMTGQLFDIRAEFTVGQAKAFGLSIGARKVTYDVAKQILEGMPLKPSEGRIRVQLLVDRPSLEICGNGGRAYLTASLPNDGHDRGIQAFSDGADTRLIKLEVYTLKSAWKR